MKIFNTNCQFQYDMLAHAQLHDVMLKLESLSKGKDERLHVLTDSGETLFVRLKVINDFLYCVSGWPTKDGKRLSRVTFPYTNFVFVLTTGQTRT
jgi:hypothetical protein